MKKGTKILIVILILIILSLIGFIVYDKVFSKKEVEPVKQEKVEKENLDEISSILLEKINTYDIDQLDAYEENLTFSENPNNNQLISMLYYFMYDNNKDEITKEEADNYFNEVYGITLNTYPDILCKLDDIALVKYDNNNSKYILNPQHLGHGGDYIKSLSQLVTNITKEGDNYVLTLAKLYSWSVLDTDEGHYHSDGRNSNTITVLDQFINQDTGEGNDNAAIKYFESHKEDFDELKPQYKYTFKKDNDNYYLISYEVIN